MLPRFVSVRVGESASDVSFGNSAIFFPVRSTLLSKLVLWLFSFLLRSDLMALVL